MHINIEKYKKYIRILDDATIANINISLILVLETPIKHSFPDSIIFVAAHMKKDDFVSWCNANDITEFNCFWNKAYELSENDFVLFKLFCDKQ